VKSLENLDVKGRRVFLRVDFNVPLDENGVVRDDTRIRASLPTITFLLDKGAKLVVASHLGRPKGIVNPKMSLKPASARLADLIPNTVVQAADVIGEDAARGKKNLGAGEVLVLENLRFHKEETADDPDFARRLAEDIDIYINDAFGACHRAHASVKALAECVSEKAAGFLLHKEVEYLRKVALSPEKPYVAVLGGAKVSDKIPVLEKIVTRADRILVGGAMAYTFFKALGRDVGRSLVEDEQKDIALDILRKAENHRADFRLPEDHVLSTSIDGSGETRIVEGFPFPGDMMGVDIGPRTSAAYAEVLAKAKTIFWNGPMGVFETEAFSRGTTAVAEAVAASPALSIVGGGDSVAAVHKAGVADRISHISTGGGASLEFLAYETLPGIEALEKEDRP
jgi:phosphoglycerate kinase